MYLFSFYGALARFTAVAVCVKALTACRHIPAFRALQNKFSWPLIVAKSFVIFVTDQIKPVRQGADQGVSPASLSFVSSLRVNQLSTQGALMKIYVLSLVLMLVSLSGCASVRTTDGEGKSYRYFGFVEVVVPEAQANIEAVKITSAGIAIENGLSVGWRDTEQVIVPLKKGAGENAPPEATCSMVVIVRSDTEAQNAREILSDLKGENICLTSFQ